MVVAFIALAVALGGSSYAAIKLPSKSVGSKQLKKDAVTRSAIKANAVDGTKVADDSLTGADINESSLSIPAPSSVSKATTADKAATADSAGVAGAISTVYYRTGGGSVGPAVTAGVQVVTSQIAACDAGQRVIGGGVKVSDPDAASVQDSAPTAGGTGWIASVGTDDIAGGHGYTVYAICIPAPNIG
jgi:hypothetical protein